jgi:hypothetical protein
MKAIYGHATSCKDAGPWGRDIRLLNTLMRQLGVSLIRSHLRKMRTGIMYVHEKWFEKHVYGGWPIRALGERSYGRAAGTSGQ